MINTISREQIKQKLDAKEPITLVEALPDRYYQAGHLPGAINIPHDEIREKAAQLLPDKNALIAVYCASTECQNSRVATQVLVQMGYSNAHEYVEGKQDWQDANLPVDTGQEVAA